MGASPSSTSAAMHRDEKEKLISGLLSDASDLMQRRMLYHPCDGSQHPQRTNDGKAHNAAPPCFWMCSPFLQTDQRCIDCAADVGCGVYDEKYGSHGPHPLSACPCNGLTPEELATIRQNNGPLCGCRLSDEERHFEHHARKLLCDDPELEIVTTLGKKEALSESYICRVSASC